jgi:F-type H+-transporting ATPase subunit gamma
MATQIKTIKQKINSISNIKKITKTMEMVSVAKMKKAVQASLNSREYAKYALEILKTLASKRSIDHVLLQYGSGEKTLMVIVASNKGLCGSYNMNISKLVHKYKAKHAEEIEVITIGKQAEKIANRNNFKMIASFHEFGEHISLDEVTLLQKLLLKEFLQPKQYKKVVIVYTEFIKQLSYKPIAREILPVSLKTSKNILEEVGEFTEEIDIKKDTMPLYTFEPTESRVLDKVIPNLLTDLLLLVLL